MRLRPRVVAVDPKSVEEVLREEYELEKIKYTKMPWVKRLILDTSVNVEYIILSNRSSEPCLHLLNYLNCIVHG